MRVLFLLINSMCDISCTYCFYTTGHQKRSHFRVRPEKAIHVAKKITSAGFSTVILSGGDPLHSQLKHETYVLVRELKAQGLKVIINTSAAYLNEDDYNTIIDLGIDRVDISIDSHNASIHDAQRGHHTDTIQAINGLIGKGYENVVTTTVVTLLNAPTLSETIFWLQKLGVQDVRVQCAFFPNNPSAMDGIIQAMHNVGPYLHAPHALKYIELTKHALKAQPAPCLAQCRMGKEYFVCNAQGILTPCFHRNDITLGNLFNDPVDVLCDTFEHHELIACDMPPCFGSHCASLFDIPTFWRK